MSRYPNCYRPSNALRHGRRVQLLAIISAVALAGWIIPRAVELHGDDAVSQNRPAPADTGASRPATLDNLYDRVLPATIEVLVNDRLEGSGWIADSTGYAFTAAHVVVGPKRLGERVEVLTASGGRLDASVIAIDRGRDTALLKLPKRDKPYPALSFAERMPPAGTDVFVFGAPIYRHHVMLRGAVARNATSFEYLPDQHCYIEAYHVAADTPRGTSGGPWVDARGRVVGLQSGMMRDKDAQVGIAFVTPADAARGLLAAKKSAITATINAPVEEIWEQSRQYLEQFPARQEGLVLRTPDKDGAAARAGLREWDVITAVNNKPVRFRDQFLRLVRAAKPGQKLTFTVLRPRRDRPMSVEVTLSRREEQ